MFLLEVIVMLVWGTVDWVFKHLKGIFLFLIFIVCPAIAFALLISSKGPHFSVGEFHMHAALLAFLAAIAVGTLWGWVILTTAVIVIMALVENDKGFWALTTTVAAFILLFDLPRAVSYVAHHPLYVLGWVVGYFVAGTGYGIFKWSLFVHDEMVRYNERKAEWMDIKGIKAIDTPELALAFRHSNGFVNPPSARGHKGEIMMWMMYWPFSGLWTLINDPIRKAFRAIYNSISGTLQAISDRAFKGASADMELAKQGEEAEAAKRKADDEAREQARRSR